MHYQYFVKTILFLISICNKNLLEKSTSNMIRNLPMSSQAPATAVDIN